MKSIWENEVKMPEFPALKKDIKTDVLIIGGGIAEIRTAYFLQQTGIDCVLVEKNRLCSGTSGHTTAKITMQHGLVYHKLMDSFGREKALQYLQANKQAVEQFAHICKNADCNFERKDSFVYSMDDKRKLEQELDALHKLGYDARFADTPLLPRCAARRRRSFSR